MTFNKTLLREIFFNVGKLDFETKKWDTKAETSELK
jgi:hypothetical protein